MISKNLTNAANSSEVHTIEQSEVESAFWQLFRRCGRIKDHLIKLEIHQSVKYTQQKKLPIQLQEAVQNEIARLIFKKRIEKVSTVNDNMFIQPTVFTLKRELKLALGALELNKFLVKNKYQTPNIEHLIDLVADQLDKAESETWFSFLDM